jgi:hypothetical protein
VPTARRRLTLNLRIGLLLRMPRSKAMAFLVLTYALGERAGREVGRQWLAPSSHLEIVQKLVQSVPCFKIVKQGLNGHPCPREARGAVDHVWVNRYLYIRHGIPFHTCHGGATTSWLLYPLAPKDLSWPCPICNCATRNVARVAVMKSIHKGKPWHQHEPSASV